MEFVGTTTYNTNSLYGNTSAKKQIECGNSYKDYNSREY
ncbi:hypothetical protein G436_2169 [Leptospira interrogans serovar Hardjo str. Norma]|uniref:Uncharacterized protein n=1 Tax=Leptospira interrogans serovar Hardjo str. Norma TaxID=1279460 RepID=A0A0M3TLM6_LEPIR|nr:hypothetical protein G436_2169 [Leptospira interrogans serovar Hardjo str. Norma]EKO97559.1 hypothetical protein LEP1GSC057_1993 [Leptospira interrogans str. Brem 329]